MKSLEKTNIWIRIGESVKPLWPKWSDKHQLIFKLVLLLCMWLLFFNGFFD